MRLRRSGITLILSINNLQRCRRYRKKPYHENIIPAIWLSSIYSFNERRHLSKPLQNTKPITGPKAEMQSTRE